MSALALKNSVGGKYGRSQQAASGFFVQLCWESLSDEHNSCLCSLETFGVNCLCVSALALKNPFEGNTCDQEKLCLFSLSSFVWNYYLINILNTRLYWNWSEWIVHVSVSLGKFSWNSEVLFFQKSLHKQSFEEFAVKIFGVWRRFAISLCVRCWTPSFYLHKNFLQRIPIAKDPRNLTFH